MEYTIKVSPQEADLILESLAEGPFKKVANTFVKIRDQVVAQQQGQSGLQGVDVNGQV